ncbi:Miro domain containing protein [Trichuris trichiura]|uniref:Miro domain containing protein n=1 Tax=Trichuris trichiura TaxID=36087 RepID=A0A077ZD45_TRITR|nr:Miro domain containing protein [Trichuris trichiura]
MKVKIVVVGDSQAGKTSFIRSLLTLKEPDYLFLSDEQPEPTAGAKVEVFRHRYKCEYASEDVHVVELFDIGGSAYFKDIRTVFYNGTDGIIFVYSTLRSNAFTSLLSWVTEVLNKQMMQGAQMPVLVVGTKVDLMYNWGRWGRVRHFDGILERILHCDPFAEEITLSNQVPIANGSPTFMALNRFLDRVVLNKVEPIVKPISAGYRVSIHKWANRSST